MLFDVNCLHYNHHKCTKSNSNKKYDSQITHETHSLHDQDLEMYMHILLQFPNKTKIFLYSFIIV